MTEIKILTIELDSKTHEFIIEMLKKQKTKHLEQVANQIADDLNLHFSRNGNQLVFCKLHN